MQHCFFITFKVQLKKCFMALNNLLSVTFTEAELTQIDNALTILKLYCGQNRPSYSRSETDLHPNC